MLKPATRPNAACYRLRWASRRDGSHWCHRRLDRPIGWRLADALDMLSDATAYAVGLAAIGRAAKFKANAAMLSGGVLLLLGVGVSVGVGRRATSGSVRASGLMIGTALLLLVVNMTVLRMLTPLRSGDVHLRASWIFTRADVVANVGVVLSGVLVALTQSRYPDLIVGTLMGLYVMRAAFEILGEARTARHAARGGRA